MSNIKIYQVDAFADELFKGNPAAVCPIDEELPSELMQKITSENNLSETAFIFKKKTISYTYAGLLLRARWTYVVTPHSQVLMYSSIMKVSTAIL